MLLDKARRLLERNRKHLALGAGRNVVRRHKDLGEVHVRDQAEHKHREDAEPAEARGSAQGRSTRLLSSMAGRMYIPSAKRRRDHAGRQRKDQAAIAQKRRAHGTQCKQQPIVARKEHGGLLARTLGIGISAGQATCHELDGLHEQHQKRIGKQHVFGEQRRVVGEHRHKRKKQQDDTADRQADSQLAQRRDGICHAGGRDHILGAGVDDEASIGAVEKRKPKLHARADNGRMHDGMMTVEQYIGVKQAQVVARAVGIVEPLANLRARVSHKEAGQRGDKRGRPGNHEHKERPSKRMDREHSMGGTPHAAKVSLRKRNAAGAQPIQKLKSQVEGHDRQEHPARATDPGAENARLVAKHDLGRIGEVVATAEHHADGKEQRR